MVAFANKYGFETVPIISELFTLDGDVQDLVKIAEGPSKINPQIHREGLVLRSIAESNDVELGRLSFKVENKKFRLKYD